VVGQVLEYAAGVWGMGFAEFEHAFASRTGKSPLDHLREAGIAGWDETSAAGNSQTTSRGAGFRILIAVDRISARAAWIIEYVNSQPGDLRLVALELPYFHGRQGEMLVPQTYGDEIKGGRGRGRPDRRSAHQPSRTT